MTSVPIRSRRGNMKCRSREKSPHEDTERKWSSVREGPQEKQNLPTSCSWTFSYYIVSSNNHFWGAQNI